MKENQLPRSTPEAQGLRSQSVLDFIDESEESLCSLHSFMLVHHGEVVAEGWWEPYRAEIPHLGFSLSKSFTSTAVGLAIAEGRLNVDDTVVSLLPDDLPAIVSSNLAAMRVRHLLSMNTGHAENTMSSLDIPDDDNWARAILAIPVSFEPGTHFMYNTGASYLLSAIVQRLTGERLLDYLTPRLFEPLGIEGATWEQCPRGIDKGGFGLSITTEDIAKFGLLYLQRGLWRGRQLVPPEWVDDATSLHAESGSHAVGDDWAQGYGYQFWRCQHDAYRGDGAFGQLCIVLPEQNAVVAITAGLDQMQAQIDMVWKHLLPAMTAINDVGEPSGENTPSEKILSERLAQLAIPRPAGSPTSAVAAQVSGVRYEFPDNDVSIRAVELVFTAEVTALTVTDSTGEHCFSYGFDSWTTGHSAFIAGMKSPLAAAGAWAEQDTFVTKLIAYETPFTYTMTAAFSEDELILTVEQNVTYGPTVLTNIVGKRTTASA